MQWPHDRSRPVAAASSWPHYAPSGRLYFHCCGGRTVTPISSSPNSVGQRHRESMRLLALTFMGMLRGPQGARDGGEAAAAG
jgi:hypothetical protein